MVCVPGYIVAPKLHVCRQIASNGEESYARRKALPPGLGAGLTSSTAGTLANTLRAGHHDRPFAQYGSWSSELPSCFPRSSPGRRAPSPRRPCGRPLAADRRAGLGVKREGNISCCGPLFYSWSSLTPGTAAIRWHLKQDKWPWQMNKRSWRL